MKPLDQASEKARSLGEEMMVVKIENPIEESGGGPMLYDRSSDELMS